MAALNAERSCLPLPGVHQEEHEGLWYRTSSPAVGIRLPAQHSHWVAALPLIFLDSPPRPVPNKTQMHLAIPAKAGPAKLQS